ncbi:hypothetical protein Hdeb2414_s0001g00017151 [Helianthus debilis subsp. tardiflorus]
MAKLTSSVVCLIAIVVFSKISAYRTIIITPIKVDIGHEKMIGRLENPIASKEQCPKIRERGYCYMCAIDVFNFPKVDTDLLGSCCSELNIAKFRCKCDECECPTIKQAYNDGLQKFSGVVEREIVFRIAQNLLKECKSEIKDCKLVPPEGSL